jgi:hypothetical protein
MPFAAQAGGGSNPMAQIGWMWGYMNSAWGGPIGAANHERQFSWYSKGGPVKRLAAGGMINEHVLGLGASGTRYELGERGSEVVTSQADMAAMLAELKALRRELVPATREAPARFAYALDKGAHAAAYAGR